MHQSLLECDKPAVFAVVIFGAPIFLFTYIGIKTACHIGDQRGTWKTIVKGNLVNKGLDRAPKLPLGLRGAVKGTFLVIDPAHHRHNMPGLGISYYDCTIEGIALLFLFESLKDAFIPITQRLLGGFLVIQIQIEFDRITPRFEIAQRA